MERDRDEGRRRRDEDEPRRRRTDDDDAPRRTRSSEDDDRPTRSRRDDGDSDRGRRRDDDDRPRSRARDEDEPSSRRSRDREDDRGSRRGGFQYRERSAEQHSKRANMGAGNFDKFVKDGIKMWKPNDGDNRIRILPPTWEGAEHYGLDIHVHYGVGAERQSFLDLTKMKKEPDPIHEAMERAREDGDEDYAKELAAKRRVLVYLVDRDHPKDGVQAWAMPWTVDRDIVNVCKDKSTGEVLNVDHPDDGYDVEFVKKGQKNRTEYTSVAIARRDSPLGKQEWLDYAMDNPLPEQLVFYSYEHIKKAMGGGSYGKEAARNRDRDDDRGERRSSRSQDDDREERRPSRDRDDDRPSRGRSSEPDAPTWESVHEMTKTELLDLIEDEKLHINPKEAKDTEDLADWICDELKLKKEEEGRRRRTDDDDDDRGQDKLRRMREARERD